MFETLLINTNQEPLAPVGILLRLSLTTATSYTVLNKFVGSGATFKYQLNGGPVTTPGTTFTIPAGEHLFNLIPDPNAITLKAFARPGDFEAALVEIVDWANPGTHNIICKSASNLTKVPDYLPSMITSMYQMFSGCRTFNQNINGWDTKNVTSMAECFTGARVFNQPLNNWNTSNVTSLRLMFNSTRAFNQNIDNWDVRKVTDMYMTFADSTTVFNKPLNNWQTDSLVIAARVFENNKVFNQPLNNWNMTKVTDMNSFMNGATAFNQNLSNWRFNKKTVTYTNYDTGATAWTAANKPVFY